MTPSKLDTRFPVDCHLLRTQRTNAHFLHAISTGRHGQPSFPLHFQNAPQSDDQRRNISELNPLKSTSPLHRMSRLGYPVNGTRAWQDRTGKVLYKKKARSNSKTSLCESNPVGTLPHTNSLKHIRSCAMCLQTPLPLPLF